MSRLDEAIASVAYILDCLMIYRNMIGVWGRVYRCNQCGNFLDFDGVNAGRGDTNFCPNCGAKMDGKGEG